MEIRRPKAEIRRPRSEAEKPLLPCYILRISISDFFRISDFGFRISDFGFRISDFGFRISDLGFVTSYFGHPFRRSAHFAPRHTLIPSPSLTRHGCVADSTTSAPARPVSITGRPPRPQLGPGRTTQSRPRTIGRIRRLSHLFARRRFSLPRLESLWPAGKAFPEIIRRRTRIAGAH